jgi:hypothetical protein
MHIFSKKRTESGWGTKGSPVDRSLRSRLGKATHFAAEDEVRWNEAVNLNVQQGRRGCFGRRGLAELHLSFWLSFRDVDHKPDQHGFLSTSAMQNWSDGSAVTPDRSSSPGLAA